MTFNQQLLSNICSPQQLYKMVGERVGIKGFSVIRTRCLFAGILACIVIGWIAMPYKYPLEVKEWFDNAYLPRFGWWVVLFAIGALVLRMRLMPMQIKLRWQGIRIAFGVAIIILLWFITFPSSTTHHYLFMILSLGAIFCVGGIIWLRITAYPFAILMMLPGLSLKVYSLLISMLQEISLKYVLLFMNTALADGYERFANHIYLPTVSDPAGTPIFRGLTISSECSGYKSFMSLLLLSLFFSSHPRLLIIRKFILILAAALIAITFNVMRINITAVLIHYGYHNLTSKVPHELLNYMVVVVEFVTIIFIYRLLLPRKSYMCEGRK